jgi:glycosyltransferase involved in cell wall biosynthesis
VRIGMNAMYLDPGRSGGPETYLRHLVPALLAAFPDLELEIATTRRGAPTLGDGALALALPSDEGQRLRRLHAEQVLVPRLARRRGWDAIHSLANTGPVRSRVPHVLTLHDVIFFHEPSMPRVSTLAHKVVVRPAARSAKVIVTAAEAARDDICATLGTDPAKFVIAPHGPGREPGPAAPEAEVRERYGLAGARVVLNVAAKRPHKNQEVLVRALARLPGRVLVLAGHPEGYDAELRALAAAEGVADRVRFADYVADPDLEALWQLAEATAFPTLQEGFGLPVLEAMRRGAPVACSDIPVLRELGGDVPHYFDPHDPEAAARAIEAAAAGGRGTGLERAGLFTWERSARATMEAYERACA